MATLSPQHATGLFADAFNNASGQRFQILIGQGALRGLDRHLDRNGLLAQSPSDAPSNRSKT